MEWINIIFQADFLSHLGSRMNDWELLKALAGIMAPIIIVGGVYAIGVVNPALGFLAGVVVSALQKEYTDLARDTVVQGYSSHSGKLASTLGDTVANALNVVSIGQAYAESGKRLGELLAARARELETERTARVDTSGPGITIHAPTGTGTGPHTFVTRKFVDFQTLSNQTGVSVENLIKMLTGK